MDKSNSTSYSSRWEETYYNYLLKSMTLLILSDLLCLNLVHIDSKVSLAAYDRYYAASTDENRDKEIKAHIASIRTHIKGLSSKNYSDLTGINSLDLVLMFVPIEPALLLAFSCLMLLFMFSHGETDHVASSSAPPPPTATRNTTD